MNQKLRQQIFDYLNQRYIMSVATHEEHPWIAHVYYALEEDLTLYFTSSPTSTHAKNIIENTQVACAVTDTDQFELGKRAGIQLTGNAHKLIDKTQKLNAISLFNRRIAQAGKKTNIEPLDPTTFKNAIYAVEPILIKYFDESVFGDMKYQVLELIK